MPTQLSPQEIFEDMFARDTAETMFLVGGWIITEDQASKLLEAFGVERKEDSLGIIEDLVAHIKSMEDEDLHAAECYMSPTSKTRYIIFKFAVDRFYPLDPFPRATETGIDAPALWDRLDDMNKAKCEKARDMLAAKLGINPKDIPWRVIQIPAQIESWRKYFEFGYQCMSNA